VEMRMKKGLIRWEWWEKPTN